jgi:hypothetical protein
MASLNDTIVAYLAINNIAMSAGDYQTGQPEGEADQVLHWDTTKLGAQPSADQLNSAYTTHQAQLTAQAQAKEAVKTSALAKLTALGLTADEIKAIVGA